MVTQVLMPKLGLTMTEGKIVSWLKDEGEPIKTGEALVVVETDKVTIEVVSPTSGTLLKIQHTTGETLALETVIAYIGTVGEEIPIAESVLLETCNLGVSTSPETAELSSGLNYTSEIKSPLKVSPLAKKLAVQHNIDLSQVNGSAPDGRIIEADIQRVLQERVTKQNSSTQIDTNIPYFDIPLTITRKVSAQRMTGSFQNIPHFYLTNEVNLSNLVALRKQLQSSFEKEQLHLTYTDIFLYAVSRTLLKHSLLNASKISDEVTRCYTTVNVGLAVATNEGLMVVVFHQSEKLTLKEICQRRFDLIQKAKNRKLNLDDISNATFTVTNLGMYGVDEFFPIINPPQSAILAIGAINDKIHKHNGEPIWLPSVRLTLAVDHRIVDGVDAAVFLKQLCLSLETVHLQNWD